jgi:UDP-N-acetylmuramate: L-alanyl-gamma-D-glutamyl-meso-diaminopimelate ligase
VIEGDEYDTAFFEKTAKFLHYAPEVAIITSIEHDHVDIYPTSRVYLDAFRASCAGARALARSSQTAPTARSCAWCRHARADVAWFALADEDHAGVPPHWLAAPAARTTGPSLRSVRRWRRVRRFALRCPGVTT